MLITNVRNGPGGPLVDVEVQDGKVNAIVPAGTTTGERFDADGGTVLPGLRDAHTHIGQWAAARLRIPLGAAGSAADAVARVAAAADPGTGFVTGTGFRDALWSDAPHKDLLQAALPDRPVALSSEDLHTLWLSPAALVAVGGRPPDRRAARREC